MIHHKRALSKMPFMMDQNLIKMKFEYANFVFNC